MSSFERVVVAGGDSVAWITASALARAFKHRGIEVHVVDTGAASDTPLARSTLPSQRGIHGLLGIDEPDLLVRTGGTYKLGTEHVGWQGEDSSFVHAYGEIGRPSGGLPFYKLLMREALAGRVDRPSNYSLAALAAAAGRFARPMGDSTALTSSFTYGFHLDEAAYAAHLREHAGRLGVTRIAGTVAEVERGAAGIAALRLVDGTRVDGHLFVDCTGRDARLSGETERIDWSAWLPCDRLLSARAPAGVDPPPVTRTRARAAGWTWRVPLLRETVVGYAYASAFTDEAAARALLAAAEPAAGPATLVEFRSGRRQAFWRGNCVAIGTAAIELEPLAGADLHAAQLGVGTLIELFPADGASDVERVEYNRIMSEHADALRDFTLAHYFAGPARTGAFWQAVRAIAPPERLARKLDLFRANGRIELLDFETFEETDWAWLLLGAGCWPEAIEQTVSVALDRTGNGDMAPLAAQVRQLASSMPPHIEYVRRLAELVARRSR